MLRILLCLLLLSIGVTACDKSPPVTSAATSISADAIVASPAPAPAIDAFVFVAPAVAPAPELAPDAPAPIPIAATADAAKLSIVPRMLPRSIVFHC